MVTYTATDPSGNTAGQSFNITVKGIWFYTQKKHNISNDVEFILTGFTLFDR